MVDVWPPWPELGDPTDRDEHLTAADPRLEADHGRRAVRLIEPDDHVLDTPEALAGRIQQRASRYR